MELKARLGVVLICLDAGNFGCLKGCTPRPRLGGPPDRMQTDGLRGGAGMLEGDRHDIIGRFVCLDDEEDCSPSVGVSRDSWSFR